MKTKKFIKPIIWSIIGLLSFTIPAFANEVSLNNSVFTDSTAMINELFSLLLPIMRITGIVLLTMGMFRLILSFKDEDEDGKLRAVSTVMAALIMTVLPTVAGVIIDMPEENKIEQEQEQEIPEIIEEVEI